MGFSQKKIKPMNGAKGCRLASLTLANRVVGASHQGHKVDQPAALPTESLTPVGSSLWKREPCTASFSWFVVTVIRLLSAVKPLPVSLLPREGEAPFGRALRCSLNVQNMCESCRGLASQSHIGAYTAHQSAFLLPTGRFTKEPGLGILYMMPTEDPRARPTLALYLPIKAPSFQGPAVGGTEGDGG